MKLEDIILKDGDKVTYTNGDIDYVNLSIETYLRDTVYDLKTDRLAKIERYRVIGRENGEPFYILETIWEKEEPKEIKKLEYVGFGIYGEIDKFEMFTEQTKKLNELIDEVNKLKENK